MEHTIAKYIDLKDISVLENNEHFVSVNQFHSSIECRYLKPDMKPYFNGRIIVRESVAKRLASALIQLQEVKPNLTLYVAYGYRTHEIQEKYFLRELSIIQQDSPELSKDELYEKTHARVAVPEVAGHPTGGAVDITLYDFELKKFIDMGGQIADYSNNKFPTFSIGLTKTQRDNRKLLHDVLVAEEFCPFYGEWWHFSYGDKEWACYYNKDHAVYDQRRLSNVILQDYYES